MRDRLCVDRLPIMRCDRRSRYRLCVASLPIMRRRFAMWLWQPIESNLSATDYAWRWATERGLFADYRLCVPAMDADYRLCVMKWQCDDVPTARAETPPDRERAKSIDDYRLCAHHRHVFRDFVGMASTSDAPGEIVTPCSETLTGSFGKTSLSCLISSAKSRRKLLVRL